MRKNLTLLAALGFPGALARRFSGKFQCSILFSQGPSAPEPPQAAFFRSLLAILRWWPTGAFALGEMPGIGQQIAIAAKARYSA